MVEYLKDSILDDLPAILKDILEVYEGDESNYILLSSLGVLSAAIPNVVGYYDSYKLYPNMYTYIIAPPASGKGVATKTRLLIEPIHKQVLLDSNIKNSREFVSDNPKEMKKKLKEKLRRTPEVKIIPGNVSVSRLYSHLEVSSDGVLIFETEADTISAVMKNDWGNFSDVLRRAFQHEPISMTRKEDNLFIEVKEPRISLVLTSTPNQLRPLVKSQKDGLFSRFLFYQSDTPTSWKDVSPKGKTKDVNILFEKAGQKVYTLYKKLKEFSREVEFKLTEAQWEGLNNKMKSATDLFLESKVENAESIYKRHGLMFFRISMILTFIRKLDNTSFDESAIEDEVYCQDRDFEVAFKIVEYFIEHAKLIYSYMDKEVDKKMQLNVRELQLYNSLAKEFQRQEALDIGEKLDIPKRSLDFILSKFKNLNLVEITKNGHYSKK